MNEEDIRQLDDRMDVFNKGFRAGEAHAKPSPETVTQFAVMNEKFLNFDSTLKSIVIEINSTKRWLIGTLFTLVFGGASLFFYIGIWKATVDTQIIILNEKIEKVK
jgi:hypothetical protein